MSKKKWIILFLILILGVFLRFWKLGQTPKGFYLDEAALGYNAYSIMETGKDEYFIHIQRTTYNKPFVIVLEIQKNHQRKKYEDAKT